MFSLMFFIYKYAVHLYLHSFPTRRSSDLVGWSTTRTRSGRRSRKPRATPAASRPPWRSRTSERRRSCGDRKSTRLNSSHVEISYAVFCLKKKKKKNKKKNR